MNPEMLPKEVPLRVDFAGGWLDVPRFAQEGGTVVNMAIWPTVTLDELDNGQYSGLGASAARAVLLGQDAIRGEVDKGCGWQDPAVIINTGLCAWKSGSRPVLKLQQCGSMFAGRLAIWWFGRRKLSAAEIAGKPRPIDRIILAGKRALDAVQDSDFGQMVEAVKASYEAQLEEGMYHLPQCDAALAWKYCGAGWGGNAIYMFPNRHARDCFVTGNRNACAVEPYCKPIAPVS